MSYEQAVIQACQQAGVEESTMMKTPCLRYQGEFMAMMFDKADAMIIKVSPERVDELIADGFGLPFEFTKKRFKEWVLIPMEYADEYSGYVNESLAYAKLKISKKRPRK